MATTALTAITPIVITALDDHALVTLKTRYNELLAVGQMMIDANNPTSISAKVNEIQAMVTSFNDTLTSLNEMAKSINKLDPQAQVSGEATISTITVSLTGSVMLA